MHRPCRRGRGGVEHVQNQHAATRGCGRLKAQIRGDAGSGISFWNCIVRGVEKLRHGGGPAGSYSYSVVLRTPACAAVWNVHRSSMAGPVVVYDQRRRRKGCKTWPAVESCSCMRSTKRPKTPGLVQRPDSVLQGDAEDAHRCRGAGCI